MERLERLYGLALTIQKRWHSLKLGRRVVLAESGSHIIELDKNGVFVWHQKSRVGDIKHNIICRIEEFRRVADRANCTADDLGKVLQTMAA